MVGEEKNGIEISTTKLTILIVDWVEKIESLVCNRCKKVIGLMVGEEKNLQDLEYIDLKKLGIWKWNSYL
jgi:hypothetical protein